MDFLNPLTSAALVASAMLMLGLLAVRRRQRGGAPRSSRNEALDTVAGWPPEAARVLTVDERQAYDLLRRALPGFLVLAQVPLSRFVRVPTRHSYSDWIQRVGQLSADLLLCDAGSRVLAVIDIRSTQETERSRRRHERLARVLRAAGVRVHVWYEGQLPGMSEVRATLGASLGADPDAKSTASRPMPLIPVAEIEEILADGDAADHSMEPVPSGFFDDLEAAPSTRH
jgi:hypothetical protein